MSKDRDDERNTGMPGEETFSLEEILAEFGGGAAKPRWKEDTIPFPVTPRSQRTAPSPAGPPGPGKVVYLPFHFPAHCFSSQLPAFLRRRL